MAAEELHVGDIGTDIIITIQDDGSAVDVSAATIQFIFCKPDGTIVTKTGSLNGDGTDGKVKYTTESGFLDGFGDWKYQVKLTISGSVWYTDWGTLPVFKNLN
jgi:hypothetical protein